MTTLTAWFGELVRRHGEADALVEPGGATLSFVALDQMVGVLAGRLPALGLQRGDRLASFLPNGAQAVAVLLAGARLGATTIGVNTRYRSDDLRHVLDRARPRLLVSARDFLGIDFASLVAGAIEGAVAAPTVVWSDDLAPWGAGAALITVDAALPSDLAVAFTTSGTTGKPKVAGHDHAGTVRHLRAAGERYASGPGDTALLVVPFCGTFGFVSLFAALGTGAKVVVPARFEPAAAARAVATYGVTHLNASDDMLLAMLEEGSDLRSWRGGVEAEFHGRGQEVVARAEQVGARITGVYGSSETFALLASWSPADPLMLRSRNGGVPVDAATDVRVVDPMTGAVLEDGAEGELQIRGPSVLDAYVVDDGTMAPDLTADGWFATGDLAMTVPSGGFVFAAGLGDTLRLAGFLTDPAEIEQHLAAHPAVAAAQVVGAPGPRGGEIAVAFVVLESTGVAPHEAELVEHCRHGLANYKVPTRIVAIDAFPTVDGANGVKIRKTELRARASRLLGSTA